jgi:hypothetical protein
MELPICRPGNTLMTKPGCGMDPGFMGITFV